MDLRRLINIQAGVILEQVEDFVNIRQMNHALRVDPFNLDDRRFIKIFRLSKDLAQVVIDLYEQYQDGHQPTRASALDAKTKVCKLK